MPGLFADNSANRRTRIKVCGVCRVADAIAAVRAGADAVGIVCTPAAGRFVPAEFASEICSSLPPAATRVALFVNQPVDEVRQTTQTIGANCAQLHGSESPDFVRQIGIDVIKAIRVDRATFERELDQWRSAIAASTGGLDHLRGLVLESPGPGIGGTGQRNDWALIADVAARGGFEGLPPIIAAGGLTPENVGEVIAAIRPWAVDVSSGVERVKREKSPELIERFVAAVRAADQS
jgi:phosphoribosylanthranilate isomerase